MITVQIHSDSDIPVLANGSIPNLVMVSNELNEAFVGGRLRVSNGQLVDAADYSRFYIDTVGVKHIERHDRTWQEIECGYSDVLIKDGSIWRLKTEQDVYQEQYKAVDDKRQTEYTRRVRPYLEEAEIKKHMGEQSEYDRLMDLAVQEREKIQAENPWPKSPTN
ncbi:hypothetical protein [Vibrio coralliilyticus]|uniref:hypothetical protein n=1 Tax=Vibrio coralliilyticus TaxID=190893 RepID=UPI00148DFE11|nr:hypothetical protein [Vibrio coralliilyticus]NOI32307.1 hypothetical protein [Vibrio coralliilyticus]NOI51422.1 hypothetical protein [Vibrio coralliilyticus]WFB49903.1 hypothetical protein P6988_23980 [Vibrio coralliilyticus]